MPEILCSIIDVVVTNLLAVLITAVLALPIVLIVHPMTELVKNLIEENIDILKGELEHSEFVADKEHTILYGSPYQIFNSKAKNNAYNQFWITKDDGGCKHRLNMVVGNSIEIDAEKFFKDYASSLKNPLILSHA